MKVQITQRIARKIFEYFEDAGLKNIIMISNKSKRITFDNFFYRDQQIKISNQNKEYLIEPLYINITKFKQENKITFIYLGDEITVDDCYFVYKDREEKISLDTVKGYFIEEIINNIAQCEGFKWEYK